MNKFLLLGIAFAIAIVGPVSAATSRYFDVSNPRIVAGQINANGNVERGLGFTARHIATGEYEIRFQNDSLRGCAAMVISAVASGYSNVVGAAYQPNCGRKFDVDIWLPGQDAKYDQEFQFIAAQE
jgi:hypothetical protein